MPRGMGAMGLFLFLERIIMSESEFYKSISKVTGETSGRLRRMGFSLLPRFKRRKNPEPDPKKKVRK